ncbi:rho-N domain-containing protein 1, chloroplastic-like [Salvia splendens]|uniref:rho-N domain-containing protein 1, chloroplastic-like n=1 Tax=Salvia splendens TaxID=180675 RepID=UPI001C268861|nr:rho-N domain-containing protein 1, chloroplastic-like [Salvia splendens]XP_042016747.1 rho-N domain-containing protein 1, chloroplastic-like [Salvia splendens]
MSRSIDFISKTIPGYGPSDSSPLPCSGISGKALSLSHRSCREHKLVSDVKFFPLRCVSRYTSSVCNASSSNYRRNPDFPNNQRRHGYSRNRNRQNETREECDDHEEFETLSSKNGPLLSASNHKYQATATTGPREKEIVELFRKVQAQLRERAAMKEGKKIEESQTKSKESETVDSLLKLLRKHSVQQGKKSYTTANCRDFILDQDEQTAPSTEEGSTSVSYSNSTSSVKHEAQESPIPRLTRPKSNFRKRSPVPEIKFQPVYAEDSISEDTVDTERKWSRAEPEAQDDIQVVEYDSESEVEPFTSEIDAFDETSGIVETENEDVAKEDDVDEAISLNGMKLAELRALAKSRGMKGFSKLKKSELIELLSGGSV